MNNKKLLQIIEQAAKNNVLSLDLSNHEITTLSPEISKLANLSELNLKNNRLTTLPPEIGKLSKLSELDLRDNQLTELPPEVGELINLTKLSLNNNQLTAIPSEIGKLRNLNLLFLGDNQLTTLPPEIGKLTNLTRLSVRDNQLTSLPPEIGELTNLTGLILGDNQITVLPPEIGKLTNLTRLNVRDNQLTTLPSKIGKLTKLTWLNLRGNPLQIPYEILILTHEPAKVINYYSQHQTEIENKEPSTVQVDESNARLLNLSHRGLTKFPPEINKLTTLTWLELRHNKLTMLSPELGKLTTLKRLNLGYNQFTMFPPEIANLPNLTELDLSNNQITTLPPEIGDLTNLKWLVLERNQITTLPPEIGKLKNLMWFSIKYNRLTMLPLEIGKLVNLTLLYLANNQLTMLPPEIRKLTNLMELDLQGNPLPIPPEILALTNEPAKIINYYFQHQKEQKKPLNEAKVVIVGQGAVGKTSLVRRLLEDRFDPYENKTDGINIKQWNITVNDTEIRLNLWDFGGQEIMHATHQFFLTKRSLYLLVLDSRLDEQENRVEYWLKIIQSFGGNSPIIVVCNKGDEHDLNLNWRGLQEKYPTIKAFAKNVSCKTSKGIEELKVLIEHEVGQLEHIHDELILSWFAVKSKLETMEADYISYDEYQNLCNAEQISDELSQQTLLGFLHDLGIVLHFHEHPVLEETNVLNPEWVTKGVYQILNSYELFQSKGKLEHDALDRILDLQIYPRKKQQFILDMMRQFELCFDFDGADGKRFLVPDLLSKEEPDTGDWSDSLAFQYHYDVLPSSIISRFIVRMHVYISKRTYWRNGVVLMSEDGNNRALVKADIEDKKIFIYVTGRPETQRTLLEIIRAEFRKIHVTIPKIEVKEKVPLPEEPKVVVDYKHLLKLESLGRETYFPEGAVNEINVSQLLDRIEPKSQRIRKVEQQEIRFEPRIEVNPNIQVNAAASASSEISINIEIKQAINFLQGSLSELKEEVTEVQPELKKDLEKVEKSVEKIEDAKSKEEVAKSSALPKLRRFLKEANDTGTTLGKTIKGIKSGYSILQDIAGYYNKIAQWCGMPVIPDVFLKKDKKP